MSAELAAKQDIATLQARMPAVMQATEESAILSMIERAARDPSVDLDRLERLMKLRDDTLARNAKVAFSAAFSEMQTNLPAISERGKGHGGITYALWEDINDTVKPVLADYGFGLSFRTRREADRIVVTGILSHGDGHSEASEQDFPLDTSGSKNAIQAVGSSISYGKRYVAAALLNLSSRAVEDRDDDGQAAGIGSTITDEQLVRIRGLADEVQADVRKFCEHLKVLSLAELPAKDFDRAVRLLEAKRGRR